MTASNSIFTAQRTRATLVAFYVATLGGAGCQQKMAEQPYYKPYEPSPFFADGRSNRPLEAGVVHRGQHLDSDPLATGLTAEEWGRYWKGPGAAAKVDAAAATPPEDRTTAYGAPRFDPRGGQPHSGPAVYVTEFPFEITDADLSRGSERYTAFCAMCHGPLGNGKGKIWERGYLKPTSYHTEPVEMSEPAEKRGAAWFDVGHGDIPLGYSRGYWKWDVRIPVRDVPVGYIFEVITKGYGAMGDYAAQIKPDDRWRIIAYVRTLQMSQRADAAKLPADVLQKVNEAGGKHQ